MSVFKNVLIDLFNKQAPVISKRVKGTLCPWPRVSVKNQMNRRNQLLIKFRKSKSEIDTKNYKNPTNKFTRLIRKAREQHYEVLLTDNEKNSNKFWKIIKQVFPSKSTKLNSSSSVPIIKDATFGITENNNANIFCKYYLSVKNLLKTKAMPIKNFAWHSPVEITSRTDKEFNFEYVPKTFIERELRSLNRNKATGINNLNAGLLRYVASVIAAPLSFLINLSLQTGIVPLNWKVVQVIPLYKKGDKTEASNYRAISILPILRKVLERSVHYQLVNYLEQNNLFSVRQYDYRKRLSSELATAYLVDKILKAADKGLITGVLFVDLSKAFDTPWT